MQTVLSLVHVTIGILLCVSILVQHRVSGLSSTFGGSGSVVVQRRGAEKALYKMAIWLALAFFGLAVARWYI